MVVESILFKTVVKIGSTADKGRQGWQQPYKEIHKQPAHCFVVPYRSTFPALCDPIGWKPNPAYGDQRMLGVGEFQQITVPCIGYQRGNKYVSYLSMTGQ